MAVPAHIQHSYKGSPDPLIEPHKTRIVCNHCNTPVSKCEVTQMAKCMLNYKQGTLQLLHDQIVTNNVYCVTCSNHIGFRIVNLVPKLPEPVPYESYDTSERREVVNFVNSLISIENELNWKIERIRFLDLLNSNQNLIGSFCLNYSNITQILQE